MSSHTQILGEVRAVFSDSIHSMIQATGADPCFTADADTQIFGNNSVLDSLGLVNLVTMFEESIAEKFAIEIDIWKDSLSIADALTISDLLIETAAMLAEVALKTLEVFSDFNVENLIPLVNNQLKSRDRLSSFDGMSSIYGALETRSSRTPSANAGAFMDSAAGNIARIF